MKKNTWFLLVLCLPLIGLSQGVKTNHFDKFLKKQRIETEPVVITGLPQTDRLAIDLTAVSSDLFLNLSGAGWGAATVDKENELVLLFANDSSISLKAATLQSFEPGLTEHAYRHQYLLNFQQLAALHDFDLVGLRKYSFNTYTDITLPAGNRDAIKKMSALFLAELQKSNITNTAKQINLKDIRNYIGDSVAFCSRVYRTRYFKASEDGPTLLDVQADFSDPFVNIVILEKDRPKFNNAPEETFLNKNVCITGIVRLRNNIPYLVVQNANQIRMNSQVAEKEEQKPAAGFAATPNGTGNRATETLAEYPGGAAAFFSYIETNLAASGTAGTGKGRQVIVSFLIDAQGNCSGIKMIESAGSALDDEIKKLLLKMPKWKPAFSNGRFVATRITQPISIKAA